MSYDNLMTVLHANAGERGFEAYVTFRKKDGTLRDMRCTLGAEGEDRGEFARVWDLDERGYRTIRRDALLTAGW
jgi:hypothetical protein